MPTEILSPWFCVEELRDKPEESASLWKVIAERLGKHSIQSIRFSPPEPRGAGDSLVCRIIITTL